MNIILSIHPEFVEQIIQGAKKYEYRRKIPKKDIHTVYIYTTRPIGLVTAKFSVKNIISGDLLSIWEKTKDFSGITERQYLDYFAQNNLAHAIEIDNFKILSERLTLEEFCGKKYPPQNFYYLK